jgi:ribonucleoside-diphosphate reductase alpha chain
VGSTANKDVPVLSPNAVKVLENRYLLRDESGRVTDTSAAMFRRVAHAIASVDEKYGGDVEKVEEEFYETMASLEFLPNSPTLMNAGTERGQLSGCFVLPVEDSLKAGDVFDLISATAWKTGDPGMVFLDEINRQHPLPHMGEIETTNPCGEIPLLPYESCNLGSVNLSVMVDDGGIDWDKLRETVRRGIHFLDNVIDANRYPLEEIETITRQNRKIGLGVMGIAELLTRLSIPYDSEEALEIAGRIMEFIRTESVKKSVEMGKQRDNFPNFGTSPLASLYPLYPAMRNATLNTVAPTGTLSIIADTSPGIEPLFAVSFIRNVMDTQLPEVNPVFEEMARSRGFHSRDLMLRIAGSGSIRDIPGIPTDIKRIFVTTLDITPEWHVRMQAAFQEHVDNAVAKTVNLPTRASPADVRKVFMLAYRLKCKGITAYRYGSRREQVLVVGNVGGGGDNGCC